MLHNTVAKLKHIQLGHLGLAPFAFFYHVYYDNDFLKIL